MIKDRLTIIIMYMTILFSVGLVFTLQKEKIDPLSYPGTVYLPESKLVLTKRLDDHLRCMALCEEGVYHQHHLKHTHIGKCT